MGRFIKGYSCSEISSGLNNGISESHVRLLSNRGMEIFMEIHNDNIPKLKDAMNSYILQIDGTTDSEFAMVIVVRDAISRFTLYAEKCHSESFENIKDILLKVKKKFGIPSGAISDMSKNIIIKNYAIGKDEYIEFPVDLNVTGGSSAYSVMKNKTINTRSVSISSILEEFSIKDPFLLDLDIKGKEFDTINDQSISKFKMIRIEYSTSIDGKKIGERQQLIDKLKKYGFNRIRIFKHNEGVYDLMDIGTIEAIQ